MESMPELETLAQRLFHAPPNAGHGLRKQSGKSALDEIKESISTGENIMERSLSLIEGDGLSVLDVGCSWGPLVFGAACSGRIAHADGIEIEQLAVDLGNAVVKSKFCAPENAKKIRIDKGLAEALPYDDGTFDLITCHTVIEHVEDVEKSLNEMARVLKPGGVLHLEAPNYIWPYEPHLQLWMAPLGPRWLSKLIVKLCGKDPAAIDQLQFVHPFIIERILKNLDVSFENIYLEKLESILIHEKYDQIKGHKKFIAVLRLINRLGLSKPVFSILKFLGIYSSLEYRIRKL